MRAALSGTQRHARSDAIRRNQTQSEVLALTHRHPRLVAQQHCLPCLPRSIEPFRHEQQRSLAPAKGHPSIEERQVRIGAFGLVRLSAGVREQLILGEKSLQTTDDLRRGRRAAAVTLQPAALLRPTSRVQKVSAAEELIPDEERHQ